MIHYVVHDLRAFLEGRWELSRAIDDRRGARTGWLDGAALFLPQDEGLLYAEQGLLRLGPYEGEVARRYHLTFPMPALAEVAFDDGRLFHAVDLTAGTCTAEHRCGKDLYCGSFGATSRDSWTAVWRVCGPRKDYTLSTRYRRRG